MEKGTKLLEGSIWKGVVAFAIPLFLGNLFQQLYNTVDSLIVGNFLGSDALAAVSSSGSLIFLLVGFFNGIAVGAGVVISKYFGARDYENLKKAVHTDVAFGLISGLLLTVIGMFLAPQILVLMGTPESVLPNSILYFRIYFAGSLAFVMYNIVMGILQAVGDSRHPLYYLIFSSIVNIVLDLLFVIQFGMAVRGVAVATLIAQGLSAVLSFCLLMRKLRGYEHRREEFRFYDRGMMLSMVKVAIPSILQQSIVQMGILLVQSVVNTFGSSAIAGYSAGTRIESISIVPMLAIGNAMSTFTAQNIGAGNEKRVREGYRTCYFALAAFAAALCVLTQSFGSLFISAFLDAEVSEEAFSVAMSYADFISFFYILIGLKATTDGLLRGAGDVTVFTVSNLANLTIRVFVASFFATRYGLEFVWYAVPLGWATNYAISFGWYLTGHWKRIRLIEGGEKRPYRA